MSDTQTSVPNTPAQAQNPPAEPFVKKLGNLVDTSKWEVPSEEPQTQVETKPIGEQEGEDAEPPPAEFTSAPQQKQENNPPSAEDEIAKRLYEETFGDEDEQPQTSNQKPKPDDERPTEEERTSPYTPEQLARLERLAAIETDPIRKKLLDDILGEGDIYETIETLRPVDYSKKSDEEIWRDAIKALGLTQEEIEQDMELFAAKGPAERRMLANQQREKLMSDQKRRMEALSRPRQQETMINTFRQEGLKELDTVISKIKSEGEYRFVKFTPEMVEQLKQYCLETETIPFKYGKDRKPVGFDIPKLVSLVFFDKFEKNYRKTLLTTGSKEGFKSLYEKRFRPNANQNTGGAAPVSSQTWEDAHREARSKLYGNGKP